jgi:hypothetical protein
MVQPCIWKVKSSTLGLFLNNPKLNSGFPQYFHAVGGILNSDRPHRLSLASVGLYSHVVLFNILVLGKRV